MRACEGCGRPFKPRRSNQRFHDATCRQRGNRSGSVTELVAPNASLIEATRAQLVEAGQELSPAGVSALLLAAKLDGGGDTGSAMAALAKQHLVALAEALKDAPRKADRIDELKARRLAKLGA